MIPQKLTIKGFLSYQEPTEIDFSGLHVACITGQNGAGKSTMLDAMTWALFGEARRSDDSVINDVVDDKTAKVDFEFRYEDADYRVSRQKTKGKSTIAEFFVRDPQSGQWRALTEKRVTDTNKKIRDTLRMDYKTFINASFFLQGKADQFTGQNAAERKKVLSTILDLDVWEEYKARAAEKRRKVESEVSAIRLSIDEAERELDEEPARRAKLAEVEEQLREAETRQKMADMAWEIANQKRTAIGQMRNLCEQKKKDTDSRAQQVQKDRQYLFHLKQQYDLLHAQAANADEITSQYNELQALRARMDKLNRDAQRVHELETQKSSLMHRIAMEEERLKGEMRQLLQESHNLELERNKRDMLTAGRGQLQAKISQLENDVARKDELKKQKDEIEDAGSEAKARVDLLDSQYKDLNNRLDKLRNAPVGYCPTCGQELDEEHRRLHVQEMASNLENLGIQKDQAADKRLALRNQYKSIQGSISSLEQSETNLASLKTELKNKDDNIREIDEKLGQWEQNGKVRLTSLEDRLNQKDYCRPEQQELLSLEEQIVSLAYDRDEHDRTRVRMTKLAGAEQKYHELISNQSKIEPLEKDIQTREARLAQDSEQLRILQDALNEAEKALRQAQAEMPDLQAAERERKEALAAVNSLHTEEGKARQLVIVLDDVRTRLKQYNADLSEKRALAERYKTLEKAFGKDGIPALLIEQAIPEIEEQANQLLQQLSNGSMTLRLSTQGEYKSGKRDDVKETLDILIADPYGVREYEMFSGGEAFRVNFSLRLALSRMLAQRAGSRLQTLVIDEGFGSQDDEGRARLVEAITAVQNDFEKILVITHLSELKEAFPARIEVSKTESGSHAEVIL